LARFDPDVFDPIIDGAITELGTLKLASDWILDGRVDGTLSYGEAKCPN